MSDLDFPDIQGSLSKLEEAFQDHNSYQFKRVLGELRRAVKMRANAAALARAELLDCRKDSERIRKQCLDLQAKLKTVVDRFEGSFTAFEKFRKAIRVVEVMGVASVCEAAAILASTNRRLLVPKTHTARVTAALAV